MNSSSFNFRFETKFNFSFSGVSSRMLLMHYEVSYLLFMHLSVDIINICQGCDWKDPIPQMTQMSKPVSHQLEM